MQSVTSNAVAGEVSTINDNLIVCMRPRVFSSGSTVWTFSQFSTYLFNNGVATASFGSVFLSDGPTSGDDWYNYIYIPHRTGSGGDNNKFGTLLMTTLTHDYVQIYLRHLINGTWGSWRTNN